MIFCACHAIEFLPMKIPLLQLILCIDALAIVLCTNRVQCVIACPRYQRLIAACRPSTCRSLKKAYRAHCNVQQQTSISSVNPVTNSVQIDPMEVEVKIRILTRPAFDAVLSLFKSVSTLQGIHHQENYFLDSNKVLESKRMTFRLRKTNKTDAATLSKSISSTLTMKGKGTFVDGISRREELECPIDDAILSSILDNPPSFVNHMSTYPILSAIRDEMKDPSLTTISGSFSNIRHKFAWQGYILEVDETKYAFGDAFEIELETEEPVAAKLALENILKQNSIPFTDSKRSKFANLKHGSVL